MESQQIESIHPLGTSTARLSLPCLVIVSFFLVSILLSAAGAGSAVTLAFPAAAVSLGLFLYFREPLLYNGFVWWMWFLSPFIRRLADWKSGFTDPSLILLSPYLVSLITIITFFKYLPRGRTSNYLPFVMSFGAIAYSFLVALVYRSPFAAGIGLVDWLPAITFGFHLFVHWPDYPSYRRNTQRVFIWGVLVMGAYGIAQYLLSPEWDLAWRLNAEFWSAGDIFSTGNIRVWSTMNSPTPFANTMMAGLLILLNYEGGIALPAVLVGFLSFLLSLARASWGALIVGLVSLVSFSKENLQIRLIVAIGLIVLCLIPLTTIDAFSEAIYTRLGTLTNISEDGSAADRAYYFALQINDALRSVIGEGVGGKVYDWGIFSLLFSLGWIGSLFYVGGISLNLMMLYRGSEHKIDAFIGVSRSIALATFAMVALTTPFTEVTGLILWTFMGLGLAGKQYYMYQRQSLFSGEIPTSNGMADG